jgi:hypothetical protein
MESKTPFWKGLVFALIVLAAAFLIGYAIYTGGNLPNEEILFDTVQ